MKWWLNTALGVLLGSSAGLLLAFTIMSFESQGNTRSPGDGFLIALCVLAGLCAGIFVATERWWRQPRNLP
jgi:hypothetical protein